MSRLARRYSLLALLLALSSGASAVGLGDLRGQPVLGQPLQLEIELLGLGAEKLDAACFRLAQPAGGDDLPWLRRASLSVRKGAPSVLGIRTDVPMREPIMQLSVQLACGHEVSRDYMLMASPSGAAVPPASAPRLPEAAVPIERSVAQRPERLRPVAVARPEASPRLPPVRRADRRPAVERLADRLMLSDDGALPEPSLRLATDLFPGAAEAKEAQREILRLEYRMLMAMHEQATTQMATADKLRDMEGTLNELQLRATEFAQRVESNGALPGSAPADAAGQGGASPVGGATSAENPPPLVRRDLPPPVEDDTTLSEWSIYGVLFGSVFGLAGWLGWRAYRTKLRSEGETLTPAPELQIDPRRDDEFDPVGELDHTFEPVAASPSTQVDFELDTEHPVRPPEVPVTAQGPDSVMSLSSTTLDEHFEANPVMELADIMLSFGRVKGAAQALQEYIDHNPQEALMPWIRLMDVYRMAGMRTEFESVARNLNQHFNVEVQNWDGTPTSLSLLALDAELPLAARPETLEEMPRLVNTIVDLWDTGDVVGYMYQLLRDNRGGQRQGFVLPVVEDLLFLIELKETANRMEKTDE